MSLNERQHARGKIESDDRICSRRKNGQCWFRPNGKAFAVPDIVNNALATSEARPDSEGVFHAISVDGVFEL